MSADPKTGSSDSKGKEHEEVDLNKNDAGGQLTDLPEVVLRRIKALKKLMVSVAEVETDYFKEAHSLEVKYAKLYKPFMEKRRQITTGEYEPNDEECDFVDPNLELEVKAEEVKIADVKGDADGKQTKKFTEVVKGVPNFWLTIIQNTEELADLVKEEDIPILEHLTDISGEMLEEPMGFRLDFHFSPNVYFSNAVLTKTYYMKCKVDPKYPLDFEGPDIIKAEGCTIHWYEGKNVTIRVINKRKATKQGGIEKANVSVPSFFSFFSPIQVNVDEVKEDGMDEEMWTQVMHDFELGNMLQKEVIPKAVLYFTGEILVDESEEEEEGETEEEDDDDDDDEEEEEVGDAPRKGTRDTRGRKFGK